MNRLLPAAISTITRVLILGLIVACPGVYAADDVWKPREINPLWQSECGSCHMAFPPALLSSSDWRILMEGLDKHFGVSASLDAKSRDQIAAFLDRNAGSRWGGHSADSQRITETSYFIKKHKSSIRMLMRGRVKTLVECVACHREDGAENFN